MKGIKGNMYIDWLEDLRKDKKEGGMNGIIGNVKEGWKTEGKIRMKEE